MKRSSMRVLVAALSIVLPAGAGAQVEPTQQEIDQLTKLIMAGTDPRAEHERLAKLEGTWEMEIRMWPEPGAQPMELEGTATNRMILGGRFLLSEAKLGAGEMRMESMTILGFDGRNEWYTAAAYDNGGTYHVAAHGDFDDGRDAIVMHGSDTIVTGNHTQTWDFVLRTVNADTYVWEIIFTDPWHTKGGPPFKMVEVTYRRRS
jgi:Protein of unknown function (DUF1579)